MPSHLHLAHRRTARNAARGRIVKSDGNLDKIRERCREDFAFFCEYVSEGKKKPAAHHLEWINQLVTNEDSSCLSGIAGKDTVILAPRGPLAVSMPVATPRGWVPIGKLKIGDLVYTEKGQLTHIVGISDYDESPTWEVVFSDGSNVRCDSQHLWKVRRMGTDAKGQWRVMSLDEIRTQKTVGMKGNGRSGSRVQRVTETCEEGQQPWLDSKGYPRYQIPVTQPVEYPKTKLPVDPYLLGALIGDGSLTKGNFSLTSADQEIIDRCEKALPDNYRFNRQAKYRYNISHLNGTAARGVPNTLKKKLIELGVDGKSSVEEFIPLVYLHASIQDREALLQGLMDTDGTIDKRGSVSFCSVSSQLIENVVQLVRSLGGIATVQKPQFNCYRDKNGDKIKATKPAWKVGIRLPEGIKPFHVTRKAEQYEPNKKYKPCRGIVDIRPSFSEKVRCIEVADECHTFLTKDYIVTHNSAKSTITGLFTAWAIGIHAEKKLPLKILYISYTVDVARPKSAAIKNTICTKRYQEIFPSVRLKKGATSNEYWSIDYKHAGIEETGDEQFTLCCAGLKGSITSKRSQLCLIDDCVKSAAEIANPEIRRTMQDNWNSVIAPTMFEGARAICLGTRFRHDDLFATTFVEANGWKQIVQQALISDEDGSYKSYWPEMWSVEYLLKKKKTAPISFSFQYMNQIVRQSELSLSPDLLIRSEIATEFDTIGIGVDLSSGLKDRNDYTVMTLGGRIGDRIHIIDYRRFRVMGNLEKLDNMMELLADWNLLTHDGEGRYYPTMNVCDIWSEAVQYQASLEADFKRICVGEHELHNLKWHAVKGFRSDKLARFRGIMGLFEQRKIAFNRYRGFMSMFDELTNFGTSSHDDCVDSLVHLVNGLMRRGSLEVDF